MKAIILALFALCSFPAFAGEWTLAAINKHIDETNFILGQPANCSGTLISVSERLIITNHHCIRQYIKTRSRDVVSADGTVSQVKYEVIDDVPVSQKVYAGHQLASQMNFQTTVIAYDEDTDLALIQFRAASIPNTIASHIYTGPPVQRGETVYAVGNPLGLDATLTRGIISSVTRRLKVGSDEKSFFQMDAGIAPGNSGGSLYNSEGQMIGIPAAAAVGTMIGLSIPYTSIQEFLSDACYAAVFDATAASHADCESAKEADSK